MNGKNLSKMDFRVQRSNTVKKTTGYDGPKMVSIGTKKAMDISR